MYQTQCHVPGMHSIIWSPHKYWRVWVLPTDTQASRGRAKNLADVSNTSTIEYVTLCAFDTIPPSGKITSLFFITAFPLPLTPPPPPKRQWSYSVLVSVIVEGLCQHFNQLFLPVICFCYFSFERILRCSNDTGFSEGSIPRVNIEGRRVVYLMESWMSVQVCGLSLVSFQ